jgi:hypothetical protein
VKIYHLSISETIGLLMMIGGCLLWVAGIVTFHFARPGTFIESPSIDASAVTAPETSP